MKRRWITVGGVAEVAIAVGATALLADVLLEAPALAAWVGAFFVSGVFAILAGERDTVAGLEWHQLLGISNLALALGLVVWFGWRALTHPDDVQTVVFSVLLVGSSLLVGFMGFDLVRGPKHFDLSAYESGPIFRSGNE